VREGRSECGSRLVEKEGVLCGTEGRLRRRSGPQPAEGGVAGEGKRGREGAEAYEIRLAFLEKVPGDGEFPST
jgi:hypothetical protein